MCENLLVGGSMELSEKTDQVETLQSKVTPVGPSESLLDPKEGSKDHLEAPDVSHIVTPATGAPIEASQSSGDGQNTEILVTLVNTAATDAPEGNLEAPDGVAKLTPVSLAAGEASKAPGEARTGVTTGAPITDKLTEPLQGLGSPTQHLQAQTIPEHFRREPGTAEEYLAAHLQMLLSHQSLGDVQAQSFAHMTYPSHVELQPEDQLLFGSHDDWKRRSWSVGASSDVPLHTHFGKQLEAPTLFGVKLEPMSKAEDRNSQDLCDSFDSLKSEEQETKKDKAVDVGMKEAELSDSGHQAAAKQEEQGNGDKGDDTNLQS